MGKLDNCTTRFENLMSLRCVQARYHYIHTSIVLEYMLEILGRRERSLKRESGSFYLYALATSLSPTVHHRQSKYSK